MKLIVSCIFTCSILIGCSDPESAQGSSSSEPSFSINTGEADPNFDQPEQTTGSLQFKIVSTVSAEEPVIELSSTNYQVRIK